MFASRSSILIILLACLALCLSGAAVGSPPATVYLSEPFTYSDGNLVGKNGWTDIAGPEIYVTGNTVQITGGASYTYARKAVNYAGSGGVIWVHLLALPGTTGAGSTLWGFWLDDTAGNNLARLYGSAATCRGRIGGTSDVTNPYTLNTGAWNDLDVRIDTVANTCEFYLNRTYMGKLSHGATPNNTLGRISFERIGYNLAAGHTIFYDDLQVGTQPAGLLCDPPAVPSINSPAQGEQIRTHTPTIVWSSTPHDAYQVRVCTANSPTTGVFWDSGEVASVADQCVTGTLTAGSYYAFVRVRNPGGWSNWSPSVEFTNSVTAYIIPAPQQLAWKSGTSFAIDPQTKIVMNNNDDPKDLFIANQLRRKVWDMTGHLPRIVKCGPGAPTENVIAVGNIAENSAVASILSTWPEAAGKVRKSEGYILGIRNDSIVIDGFDQRGTFYGCQTLILLLEQFSASPVSGLFCYDYPDLAWRGSMLWAYLDRDWDFAKEVVAEVFARYKLNVLEPGFSMRYDSHPEIPPIVDDIPKATIADYVDFMRQHFFEVVDAPPSWNGSNGTITKGTLHGDLREDQSVPDPSPELEDLCPRNPQAIQIIHDIWTEEIDLIKPKYLSTCQSEYSSLGSDSCPRCRGVDKSDLFIKFLTNDADFLASKGVTPLIWSDMLRADMPAGGLWGTWQCVSRVPKSIIIQDWDYSTKTDFPTLGIWNANGLTSLGSPYGYGIYGYVGQENIFYWCRSAFNYGLGGILAFNKYRPGWKQDTLFNDRNIYNLACFPAIAEWSWTVNRPYWSPEPYDTKQMVWDRVSPDRPSGFTVTKVGQNAQLNWTNPPESKFQGTYIVCRSDRYPTDPTDAAFVADVPGSANGAGSYLDTSAPLGATVYYAAFSHDAVRHFSATATGSVDNGTPLSLLDLRSIPDGKTVNVEQAIVTAAYQGFFYVGNEERTVGMRVDSDAEVTEGDIVTIIGTLADAGSERKLSALWVNVTGNKTPRVAPFACLGSSVCGPGLRSASLLVRVPGRMANADPGGTFFYLNDGSTAGGVKVILSGAISPISIPSGTFLAVTGIASLDSDGHPVLRPRSQADVTVFE